jgi:ubiquinone/menaquinone biosynthesis C-methylase UbiE
VLTATFLTLAGCARREPPPVRHPAEGHEATSQHSFADVIRWQAVFDDPGRAEWQKPEEVIAALALSPGMVVADIGAGTGYFLAALSRAVGPQGRVLAIDTEPNLVDHMGARAQREGLGNVFPVLAAPDNPRLADQQVDRVLIVDTYHHINDRLNYFERLRAAIKRDARVVIVDWHKRELPEGPPLEHKLAREQVTAEMHTAGYALIGESEHLPYQYLLVFAVAPR